MARHVLRPANTGTPFKWSACQIGDTSLSLLRPSCLQSAAPKFKAAFGQSQVFKEVINAASFRFVGSFTILVATLGACLDLGIMMWRAYPSQSLVAILFFPLSGAPREPGDGAVAAAHDLCFMQYSISLALKISPFK